MRNMEILPLIIIIDHDSWIYNIRTNIYEHENWVPIFRGFVLFWEETK